MTFMDSYFLYGDAPATAEGGRYLPFLVALSYCIATLGSYTGLKVGTYMSQALTAKIRNLLHVAGAFALGSGIWSMHFIGMLAYKMKMVVTYDPWLTFLSMAIAVLLAYGVLSIINAKRYVAGKVAGGALLAGVAIATMHYVGMAAMDMDANVYYRPGIYALSVVIAILASAAALGILFFLGRGETLHKWKWEIAAALIMGVAICGMHYTGMAAAVFVPFANCRYDPNQNFEIFGPAIGIVTAIILGISFTFALYSREMNQAKSENEHVFPVKLLVTSFFLTALATLWAGGNGFYVNYFLKNEVRNNIEMNVLADKIDFLKDDLGDLSRKILANDNPNLQLAYDQEVENLDAIITEAKERSPNASLRETATNLDSMSDLLEEFNKKSFKLKQQGKLQEAQNVLNADAYAEIVKTYAYNSFTYAKGVDDLFHKTTDSFIRAVTYGMYFALLIFAILPATWVFSFRSVRHWRRKMEETRNELSEQQKELQRYIGEIEIEQTKAMKARESAERSSAAKSDFLANVSHEIRTPMNGVLGMARLLLSESLTDEQHSWVQIIHNSGENLLNLINDILDVSKIEAGRLTLESGFFDLNTLVVEVMDMLILRAQEKNIELAVQFASNTPRYLIGDAVRVKQIILNLVSNAVKFTEKGYVLLKIGGTADEDGRAHLLIKIEDTGIGIPQDKIDAIFEKFTQAEQSTTRRYGGSGLGLTISRRLVDMMGGKLEVDSVYGQGSVFTFDLYLTVAQAPPKTHVPACRIRDLRVLALCESETKRRIVASYLNEWHMKSHFCAVPEEVVKEMRSAAAAGASYQFVFILHSASAQRITNIIEETRTHPELDEAMFVVAAVFGSVLATRALNSKGIAAVITKPLMPDQLQDAFKILWNARVEKRQIGLVTRTMLTQLQHGDSRQHEQQMSFHGTRVLVAEDIQINQILMIQILEKLGCHVECVSNGRKAVDKLGEANYDIVFMDCHMPEMDGFEATHLVRQMETAKDKHTTIVALTADAMTGDREKCLNAGMDDYLNKPYKPEQIADMLKKWVKQH